VSCKKEGFGPLTDSRPAVPVTVANVFDYRPAPTVKASKLENKIVITLQIPESTGRKIREITRVAVNPNGNYTAIQSTTGLYVSDPIPVNNTSVTFNTTFDKFKAKTGITTVPASNTLLTRDFYFLLTLDNGETVIPENVRVWVVD